MFKELEFWKWFENENLIFVEAEFDNRKVAERGAVWGYKYAQKENKEAELSTSTNKPQAEIAFLETVVNSLSGRDISHEIPSVIYNINDRIAQLLALR
jgi:hypothetical protein